MKKLINILKNTFKPVVDFFDKWVITPITKFILNIMKLIKGNNRSFDALLKKKSTMLITSLILAFGIYVVIDQESNVIIDQYAEILYNQPVTAYYNEEKYVVEGLPEDVDITLIGDRTHIFLAKQAPSKGVSVDLNDLGEGNHSVTLKYNQRLESVEYKLDPSNVTVTIYEKVSETISLDYDVLNRDKLDSKLYVNDVVLDRSDVIIKGAEYKLEQVATVKALVDVLEIANPKEGEVELKDIPLVAYDTHGEVIDVEIVPNLVNATIDITSPSKTVPVNIIPVGDVAFGKSIKEITTSVDKVTVYGEQEAVDALDELDIEIDVEGLTENKNYNVTIKNPSGITDISSKTISVSIIMDDSITKEFNNISIGTENLNSKYKVQALSKEDSLITVVVSGSLTNVNLLDPTSIKAYLDLKDYGVGEYEVPVIVSGSDLKLTYTSKTKKVKVRISEK